MPTTISVLRVLERLPRRFQALSTISNELIPQRKVFADFVLGGPASGKGTQCEIVASRSNGRIHHISVGQLLRDELESNPASDKSRQINSVLEAGGIVPAHITTELLLESIRRAVEAPGSRVRRVLIDGFPRNKENLLCWINAVLVPHSKAANSYLDISVDRVIHFKLSEEEMTRRALHRGHTSGRSDDNAEVIAKRLRVHRETAPVVLDHPFMRRLMIEIDADQSIEQITKSFEQIIHNDEGLIVMDCARKAYDDLPLQTMSKTMMTNAVHLAEERVIRIHEAGGCTSIEWASPEVSS